MLDVSPHRKCRDVVWLSQWKKQTQKCKETGRVWGPSYQLAHGLVLRTNPLQPLCPCLGSPRTGLKVQRESGGGREEGKGAESWPAQLGSHIHTKREGSETVRQDLPQWVGGSSPKGNKGAIPRRSRKQLTAPTQTEKCLESTGPRCGFGARATNAVSFHEVTLLWRNSPMCFLRDAMKNCIHQSILLQIVFKAPTPSLAHNLSSEKVPETCAPKTLWGSNENQGIPPGREGRGLSWKLGPTFWNAAVKVIQGTHYPEGKKLNPDFISQFLWLCACLP